MATTLLLIDLQRNMLEPPEQVPAAERLIQLVHGLLERARAAGASVVHVRNNGGPVEPDLPGTPGWGHHHPTVDGEALDLVEHEALGTLQVRQEVAQARLAHHRDRR